MLLLLLLVLLLLVLLLLLLLLLLRLLGLLLLLSLLLWFCLMRCVMPQPYGFCATAAAGADASATHSIIIRNTHAQVIPEQAGQSHNKCIASQN